ncbi:hypothetical protein ACPWT1_18515 [Ramlibacter sp. MMS24-I3-19]|uniref:hypothetical protein n=1 Tax=Ramlibacter sp. MMS24-I3-19 TaxID=3416606 RepID=UPI003D0673BB
MTTTANTLKTTTSLPLALRVGVALAIVVILSLAWIGAERSSHQAVQTAQATFSRTYVTLPRVEIVAKREAAVTPVASRAATKRQG